MGINQSEIMGGGAGQRATEGTMMSGISGEGYCNRSKHNMTSHTLQYYGTVTNTDRRINMTLPHHVTHALPQSRTTVAN